MRSRKKQNRLLFFTHFSKSLLILVFFLALITFADRAGIREKLVPNTNYYEKPKTVTARETIKYQTPTPPPFNWTVVKVDEHVTKISLPPDPRMSTSDELFDAMNDYRRSHGVNTLQRSGTLCNIAQNRANEQIANGSLDDHAGFSKYAQNQNEFSRVGEVLFGGVQPQYGVHIVEYGWDRSLTGHKEAISDPNWQFGCGGIAGYYAVFIFGTP